MDTDRADDRPAPDADDAPASDDPLAPDDALAPDDPLAPDEHESAYALLQRGLELLHRRHFAQAAIVLERADRTEPGRGSILEALGRAYYNSGQHERSRSTFVALLEVDPSAHYAHYALGQSLKQLGRPSEGRTHLRLAVALSPGSPLYRGALQRLGPPPASEDEAVSST
jgi:tetratricopeptide (TPR) repeat protein